MQVELAEERIFRLADRFSLEHAEGRAWAKRLEAFGALARVAGLFNHPKEDDFAVVYRERRLQPFWRVAVSTATAYERRRSYAVPVAPEVPSPGYVIVPAVRPRTTLPRKPLPNWPSRSRVSTFPLISLRSVRFTSAMRTCRLT